MFFEDNFTKNYEVKLSRYDIDWIDLNYDFDEAD